MIADAFFSFLNWLRLLFFNREMELALIGANLCCGIFTGKSVCLILFPFFFFFFFKNPKRAWSGGSRGERASEIASERMRARGERSVLVCFLLWFPNKFSEEFARIDLFLSFVCVNS